MPGHFAVTVPADPSALKIIRAFMESVLREVSIAEPDDIVLALDEACSNVIKHRCKALDDGQIRVKAEIVGHTLQLRIGNFCQEEEIPSIKPRDLDDDRPGGLGTSFLAQIMDRVIYEPDPSGKAGSVALVLEKTLPKKGGADAQ